MTDYPASADAHASGPSALRRFAGAFWADTKTVIGAMLRLFRRHGLRVFGLALVVQILGYGGFTILSAPLAFVPEASWWSGTWGWHLLMAVHCVLIAIVMPVGVGFEYALYRLLAGEAGGLHTLATGFRSVRLYLNTAAACFLMFAAMMALNMLWAAIPWDWCWERFYDIVAPDSPLAGLLFSIPGLGRGLATLHWVAKELLHLPLTWTALAVIAQGQSVLSGLRISVRLTLRHRSLALVLIIVMFVMTFQKYAQMLRLSEWDYSGPTLTIVPWANLASSTLIQAVAVAIESAASVVIYREMLARERSPAPLPPA